MNDAEIRGMFVAAAAARRAGNEATSRSVAGLVSRFVGENVLAPRGPSAGEALAYVAELFSRLDRAEPRGAALRRSLFRALAEAALGETAGARPRIITAQGDNGMNRKIYAVVACDRSDTADGTPTKLAQCNTPDEARAWVVADMRERCDQIAPNAPTVYDEDKMYYEDGDMSTQYGIIEVDL